MENCTETKNEHDLNTSKKEEKTKKDNYETKQGTLLKHKSINRKLILALEML